MKNNNNEKLEIFITIRASTRSKMKQHLLIIIITAIIVINFEAIL